SFQAIPPRTNGITKLTNMRSQLIASVPSGVTTGALAGLTPASGVGVAPGTVGVAVTVGDVAGLFANVVVGPAVKVKITWARTPSSTSVVANSSGFSERAGVTRYQWPSHIAVITPPNAKA